MQQQHLHSTPLVSLSEWTVPCICFRSSTFSQTPESPHAQVQGCPFISLCKKTSLLRCPPSFSSGTQLTGARHSHSLFLHSFSLSLLPLSLQPWLNSESTTWPWQPSDLVSSAPSCTLDGNLPGALGQLSKPSVMEKQQRELELLIQELKDRDRLCICVSIPFHHP